MRWRFIIKIVGALALFESLAMLVSLFVGMYYHDRSVATFSNPSASPCWSARFFTSLGVRTMRKS